MKVHARYKKVPRLTPATASTQYIVNFIKRFGPTAFGGFVQAGFSGPAVNQAVDQGYIVGRENHYHLTALARMEEPKSVQDLGEEELDFFLGDALGRLVVMVPITGNPLNGFTTVLEPTGAPYSPTTNWNVMADIIKQEGVDLLTPPPSGPHPWRAFKGNVTQEGPNPCIAAARCILAAKNGLDADYYCDWRPDETAEPS